MRPDPRYTPLMAAAGSGHADVLCLLLAWGVAVDIGKYPIATLEKNTY